MIQMTTLKRFECISGTRTESWNQILAIIIHQDSLRCGLLLELTSGEEEEGDLSGAFLSRGGRGEKVSTCRIRCAPQATRLVLKNTSPCPNAGIFKTMHYPELYFSSVFKHLNMGLAGCHSCRDNIKVSRCIYVEHISTRLRGWRRCDRRQFGGCPGVAVLLSQRFRLRSASVGMGSSIETSTNRSAHIRADFAK